MLLQSSFSGYLKRFTLISEIENAIWTVHAIVLEAHTDANPDTEFNRHVNYWDHAQNTNNWYSE